MTSFVIVPEWQASGSDRAMRLVDGAEAIRGDLPAAHTSRVEVPTGAGDPQETGVARASAIRTVHARLREHLATMPGPVVTIGGDCAVSLGAVGHAWERSNGQMALVWFDAQPDLNTAETSPSGAYAGMVLRGLLGEGPQGLAAPVPVPAGRVVLAGTRELDAGEHDAVDAHGIRLLSPADLTPDALVDAVAATGATSVYLHVDLDVLDPAEIAGLAAPVPFGLTTSELVAAIRALRARFQTAGATLAQFSPASPDAAVEDLGTILRIVGALTEPGAQSTSAEIS